MPARFGALAAVLVVASATAAAAQQTYKIGASVGLTGYAAANDRAWRDGLNLAAEVLNAKGGILGKKIELIIEDNRSEPQEAVVGYRKMMSNDKVEIFASGCVSAGNFAAAGSVVRAQDPDGAVLDPAAAAGGAEVGLLEAAAAALRGRGALSVPQGEDRDPQDRHPARSDALRDPDQGPRHEDRRRSSASRWSSPRPTSRTTPTSACRSGASMRPAPAPSSRWARAARR